MRLEYYRPTPLKKGQSKCGHSEKNLPRCVRQNYFCAAQHDLYTSNLLPMPMHGSKNNETVFKTQRTVACCLHAY